MNRIRRIVITFLIVIAIAGIIHFTSEKNAKEPAAVKGVEVAPPVDGPELRPAAPDAARIKKILTVYCFPGSQTGKEYELLVKEAVESGFASELKNGVIVIKVMDTDSVEKETLIQKFKQVPPAVILAVIINGEPATWRNLDKTGNLSSDKNAFLNYIRDNIRDFMEKDVILY